MGKPEHAILANLLSRYKDHQARKHISVPFSLPCYEILMFAFHHVLGEEESWISGRGGKKPFQQRKEASRQYLAFYRYHSGQNPWQILPKSVLWSTPNHIPELNMTLPCFQRPCSFMVVFQSLSHVQVFETPWTASCQTSLSFTISQSVLKLMCIMSVMASNHLVLCHPLLLLSSIFPSIRVFFNESALCIRWPKYWSLSFSISLSNEYLGLISFRIDWFDFFTVQGTLKSLVIMPSKFSYSFNTAQNT